MAGQTSFIVITIFGAVCMLAGIGLITSGSIGLFNDHDGYNASSWILLWAGIGLELIGGTLFAVARRIRWHYYLQNRCDRQNPTCDVTNVEYLASGAGYPYTAPPYSVQGYSGQPLNVPPAAAFAAPAYPASGMSAAPPNYEYAAAPPINQAPPAYEPPR